MTPHHEITSAMVCAYLRYEWRKERFLKTVADKFDINYRIVHKIVKDGETWNFTVNSLNKVALGFGMSTLEFMEKVKDFAEK